MSTAPAPEPGWPRATDAVPTTPNGRTLQAYARLATTYAAHTVDLDTRALRALLTQRLTPGAHVLDAGCGWGRDARAFRDEGFRVTAFDGCAEMARLATAHLGTPVIARRFQEIDEVARFDAVWARASLLHLPPDELGDALVRLVRALRPGGWLFASFKRGEGERIDAAGRYYLDMTVPRFDALLAPSGAHRVLAVESDDAFGRLPGWLNLLVQTDPTSPSWPSTLSQPGLAR